MEKTRRPDGTGRKKGNGNRSIYAEKKQERKKQEAIGERKTGRGRGTVGKTEIAGKKETFIQQKTFLGNKGEGAVAKPEREGDKREYNKKKRSLCPVNRKCGGCQFLDLSYGEQLKMKKKQLDELLKEIARVETVIGMEEPFHYRNKVHAVFDRDRRGNIISGIYQENSHIVVPVETCLIEDEKADEIIGTIRSMLKSFKIRTYDEDTGYGLLRHVLVRRGFQSGDIMVVLVTASPVFPSKNNFVRALRQKHPEITTIIQNINGRGTSMVLGDRENILYGKGYITDQLCGCTFRISSRSFYQVNAVQTEKLYLKALELAGLTGRETVLDAYCGIGTIGIIASRHAGQVIGVELNEDAVRDAVNNAKLNQVSNIRFYCNDAGRFMVNMAQRGEKADVVIMDPPRSGSTEEFMDSIKKMGAEKVVYVSCNPETLARDLKYMKKLGYRAGEAWGVDMFPMTGHVETVCLLSKLNVKHHIEVELHMDELDLTAAESKATYEEIKAYVLEHSGMKVSSLYIAQVKQKCGIIERENYNKPKSEDAKQPQCPPEKEKAIMEALRHFGMI